MLRYVLLCVLALLGGAPATAAATPEVRVRLGGSDAAAPEVQALARELQAAAGEIVRLSGVAPARPILVDIGEHPPPARTWYGTGRIEIPRWLFERGLAPLVHELAHAVLGRGQNVFLEEGLAIWFQDRLGRTRAFPNFGVDVNEGLRAQLMRQIAFDNDGQPPTERARFLELAARVGDGEPLSVATAMRWIDGSAGQQSRRTGYLAAGSFCRFVIAELLGGDAGRFMAIFYRGDYEGATGLALPEIERRWLEHLLEPLVPA